jgi:hypothetical protein
MTTPDRDAGGSAAEDRAMARRGVPVTLKRIPYDPIAWAAIVDAHRDAEVYHGPAWLAYLTASQAAQPVIAVVLAGDRPVGHFVGAIVRRYGVRILGSPLRGWGTMAMGFLLEDGADRQAAASALATFAFRDLSCVHVELTDRHLTTASMAGSGYLAEMGGTYVIDLEPSEEAVLAGMRATTRNYIRQGVRRGLIVERVRGEAFADEYHAQLVEVFGRQGLAPTYGVERVRQLIRALDPSEEVLLLRVRTPDGESVSTLIVVGRNGTAVLWGAAFRRARANVHPNELMHWEAMRYWKSRGFPRYDMGGGGDYKEKYGGSRVETVHFHRSRWGFLRAGRSMVRTSIRLTQIARRRSGRREVRQG